MHVLDRSHLPRTVAASAAAAILVTLALLVSFVGSASLGGSTVTPAHLSVPARRVAVQAAPAAPPNHSSIQLPNSPAPLRWGSSETAIFARPETEKLERRQLRGGRND